MQLRRMPAAQAGFSLIEMMLVLGIIAFIAAMVAQNVFKTGEAAKRKEALLGVKKIASEAQAYYTDNGSLPSKLDDLITKPSNAQNWTRQYLKPSQSKDPWGNVYMLKTGSDHADGFVVISYAADGKEGGTGNDADVSSAE
jgi:general secretion pathway protein G